MRKTGDLASANPFRFSNKYQDDESDLLMYSVRFYRPSTGCWLSRDGIEEDGGPNLYGFAGNEPLYNIDPFGFSWTVTRSGGRTAIASCECGDTVAGLADIVKLNAGQYRAWLKGNGTTSLPGSENDPLTSGTFLVPNTAYIDVGSYSWGVISWVAKATANRVRSILTGKGYAVVFTEPDKTTKAAILQHLASDDIYVFAYFGHGASGSLTGINDPTGRGADQGIITRDKYTQYGIRMMLLAACETNDGAEWWKDNVSKTGTLMTAHGDIGVLSDWHWVVDHGR